MAMYQIECAYTCHTGNIRANNEDNFWCFGESLPVNNEGTKGICSKIISGNRVPAMAVFDGMGGESCGEIAAFLASEEFGKFYNANKRMLRDMPEDFIDDVCEKMNQAVCRYGTEHHIWSMGSTLDDVKNAAAAEMNIVCSAAAIKAAEYLKEKFGTPYEIEYPRSCLPEEIVQKADNFADKNVLVIHNQTAADAVRKLITEKSGKCHCTSATFLMQKKELLQQSDFFLADESDLCDNVGDNYDVVIADKALRRVMKNFSGEFIDFPHFGLSGRLLQGESEKI